MVRGGGTGAAYRTRRAGLIRSEMVGNGIRARLRGRGSLGVRCPPLSVRCAALGVRCLTLGARCAPLSVRCAALGVRCAALVVRCAALGVRCAALGVRCPTLGVRCLALGVRCAPLSVRCLARSVRCVALGVRCLALGVRCLALGARCVALGARCVALGGALGPHLHCHTRRQRPSLASRRSSAERIAPIFVHQGWGPFTFTFLTHWPPLGALGCAQDARTRATWIESGKSRTNARPASCASATLPAAHSANTRAARRSSPIAPSGRRASRSSSAASAAAPSLRCRDRWVSRSASTSSLSRWPGAGGDAVVSGVVEGSARLAATGAGLGNEVGGSEEATSLGDSGGAGAARDTSSCIPRGRGAPSAISGAAEAVEEVASLGESRRDAVQTPTPAVPRTRSPTTIALAAAAEPTTGASDAAWSGAATAFGATLPAPNADAPTLAPSAALIRRRAVTLGRACRAASTRARPDGFNLVTAGLLALAQPAR